jgi:sulfur-oxidizing protein SoxX
MKTGRIKRIYQLSLLALIVTHGSLLADRLATGRALVMERSKGNCLACHAVEDGELPGNIGPPLIAMKARFPDRDELYKQIWDATLRNPDSRMPPFGKHGILSADEIRLIVDYLYTL